MHTCGGSLITDERVVTVAQCVVDQDDIPRDPSFYTVIVGAHERLGTMDVQQTIKLRALFAHEDFNLQHLKK